MRIGEIARLVGVATSAIRYYEEAGLLPEPGRTAGGYRDYQASVIDRLAFIRGGQAIGLTLAELREVLSIRERGDAPCRHVAALLDRRITEIDQRLKDLRRLRRDLAHLAAEARSIDPAECPPDSVCQVLTAVDA
jgi:DNA-binding transcriptional MerR regulator